MVIHALAPCLEEGQFIVFISHFGALHCRCCLQALGVTVDVTPVEFLSLPYAARRTEPDSVTIHVTKRRLPAAALPSDRTEAFLGRIGGALPQIVPAENVLFTSLNNVGPVLQPALMLLNAGAVEGGTGPAWHLWADGFTPAVARTVLAVERERSAILEAFGIGNASPIDALAPATRADGTGEALAKALRNHPLLADRAIAGPGSLADRFLAESVPFGLVPWASIADRLGLAAPTLRALTGLASVVHGSDYLAEGLTVDRLGLDATSPETYLRSVGP